MSHRQLTGDKSIISYDEVMMVILCLGICGDIVLKKYAQVPSFCKGPVSEGGGAEIIFTTIIAIYGYNYHSIIPCMVKIDCEYNLRPPESAPDHPIQPKAVVMLSCDVVGSGP